MLGLQHPWNPVGRLWPGKTYSILPDLCRKAERTQAWSALWCTTCGIWKGWNLSCTQNIVFVHEPIPNNVNPGLMKFWVVWVVPFRVAKLSITLRGQAPNDPMIQWITQGLINSGLTLDQPVHVTGIERDKNIYCHAHTHTWRFEVVCCQVTWDEWLVVIHLAIRTQWMFLFPMDSRPAKPRTCTQSILCPWHMCRSYMLWSTMTCWDITQLAWWCVHFNGHYSHLLRGDIFSPGFVCRLSGYPVASPYIHHPYHGK